MRTKFSILNCAAVSLLIFGLSTTVLCARDEKSIKDLSAALRRLSPTVDPREAELLSNTVHTMSRKLAEDYRVVLNPAFQNFMINIGERERGYCAHYVRDIGTRLKELKFKTLVLHWGAFDAKGPEESNCLVITARHQAFQEGIVLDAWRWGGRLFWSPIKKDHEYEAARELALNQMSGPRHSGVSAWKEDLQESAWLQNSLPSKPPGKTH